MVIIGNGLAGVWALAAQRYEPLRTRALWWFTVFVEFAIFVQVALGVGMVAGQKIKAPRTRMPTTAAVAINGILEPGFSSIFIASKVGAFI